MNDIIKNKRIPDKITMDKLKKEVDQLIGGAILVRSYLYYNMVEQYKENNYVKEILTNLVNKAYNQIK